MVLRSLRVCNSALLSRFKYIFSPCSVFNLQKFSSQVGKMGERTLLRSNSINNQEALSGGMPLDSVSAMTGRNIPFDSVIKVFVSTSKPNYMMPWQMNRQEQCTGSAFVIDAIKGIKVLLTNAHVVRDFSTVLVRRHGGSEKWQAEVLSVNDCCDLAIITVHNEMFWEGLKPLVISKTLPELYENAMVIGYPMGGDNICVTRGVVSRVTTLTYEDAKFFLPTRELIAIQLDAAINSGNSGGPALDEKGRIVGVAFSGYAGSADNIGYIIPYPVIFNFLSQFEQTNSSSKICDFGFAYMLCENPSLRAKWSLEYPNTGILVTRVAPLGPAAKAGLKENDVMMEISGSKIGNDGTIEFRRGERLSFRYKTGGHVPGTPCPIKILRDGKPKNLTIMGDITPELVPRHPQPGTVPTYFIVGGVVFAPLTCGLLDVAVEVLSEEAWQRGRGYMEKPDEEVIVIIAILAHSLTHGYDITRLPLLQEFNGKKVLNIRELKNEVEKVKDGFLSFTLADGKRIILDAKQCREVQDEILDKYQIPSTCSKNLLPEAKATAKTNSRSSKSAGKASEASKTSEEEEPKEEEDKSRASKRKVPAKRSGRVTRKKRT
eukprot:m.83716 g.83716  ORF g.83716 m.83716 type:complete len:603 (-) comp12932_c0_seq2:1392-3200(-)